MGAGQRSRRTVSATVQVCCSHVRRRIQCRPLPLCLLEYKDSPTPKIILSPKLVAQGMVRSWLWIVGEMIWYGVFPSCLLVPEAARVGVMLYSWSWDCLPVNLCRCSPVCTHIQMCMITNICTYTYTHTYMEPAPVSILDRLRSWYFFRAELECADKFEILLQAFP